MDSAHPTPLSSWCTLAVEFDFVEARSALGATDTLSGALRERAREAWESVCGEANERWGVDGEGDSADVGVPVDLEEALLVRCGEQRHSFGTFRTPLGDIEASVCQDWLCLSSESLWPLVQGFPAPAVAQMEGSGRLCLGGVLDIVTLEGPQWGGICACAWVQTHEEGADDGLALSRFEGMLALTALGFDADDRPVGVLPSSVDWLRERIGGELPPFLEALDISAMRHFNQGDALLAGQFGARPSIFAPGEAGEPLVLDALSGLQMDAKS